MGLSLGFSHNRNDLVSKILKTDNSHVHKWQSPKVLCLL